MIVDQLKNAKLYFHTSERFAVALKYLQTNDLAKFENGRYEIEDKEVFALVSEYNTKSLAEAKWESHNKYADIQYIVIGEEKMGFAPLGSMEVTEGYNPEKDITFLKGKGDYVTVKPGTFVIFFPQDAHQPGVAVNGSTPVKKVVVKVML